MFNRLRNCDCQIKAFLLNRFGNLNIFTEHSIGSEKCLLSQRKIAILEKPILVWNAFTTLHVEETLLWSKIIYGVLRHTSSCLTLNHLIIIGKYFLYINGVHDEKRPQFTDFVTLVNEKIELEKYTAITTNKLLSFTKK